MSRPKNPDKPDAFHRFLNRTKDLVELQCALEYELACSAAEAISGLTENNQLSSLARFIKRLVPEFPGKRWWELHANSRTNFLTQDENGRLIKHKDLGVVIYPPEEDAVIAYLQSRPQVPSFKPVRIVKFNLDLPPKILLECFRIELERLTRENEIGIRQIQSTVDGINPRVGCNPNDWTPKHNQVADPGGAAEIRKLKEKIRALVLYRDARVQSQTYTTEEGRTLNRRARSIFNSYGKFAPSWILGGRTRHYLGLTGTFIGFYNILTSEPDLFKATDLGKIAYLTYHERDKPLQPREMRATLKRVMSNLRHFPNPLNSV